MFRNLAVLLFSVALQACASDENGARDTDMMLFGSYEGPVLKENTNHLVVTGVEEGTVVTATFGECPDEVCEDASDDTATECPYIPCAEVGLRGVISTILGDIESDSMDVEEYEMDGLKVKGSLPYDGTNYKVKGEFSPDHLKLHATITFVGKIDLEIVEE